MSIIITLMCCTQFLICNCNNLIVVFLRWLLICFLESLVWTPLTHSLTLTRTRYFHIEALACELDTFIGNVHDDVRLSNMTWFAEFSRKLVQTKKHLSFTHLHLLLKLAYQCLQQLLNDYSLQWSLSRSNCATRYQMNF